MENLKEFIYEKLNLGKTNIFDNDIAKFFKDEESKTTLEFILDFIKRSKPGKYADSIFNYWEMYINKDILTCMHTGWSNPEGFRKKAYVEKVVANYNANNNTHIQAHFSGWSADAGYSIRNIAEVVDALENKFTNVDIDNDNLVPVGISL